jgi:hypothetical protein
MWAFKIVCAASALSCLGTREYNNLYMSTRTKEECYKSAEQVAQWRGLWADKWKIICYQTPPVAKRDETQ